MDKLKIVFAIKSLQVPGGGAERVLAEITSGLADRGHQVSILTFDFPGQSFYEINDKVRWLTASIGHPGQPTPRLGFLKALPRVRRIILDENPDVVIPFMHATYVPVSIALLGTSVPLIVSEHVSGAHYRSRRLQRIARDFADGLASAKTVPSLPLKLEQPPKAQAKIHVLPNPVRAEQFKNAAPSHPGDRKTVLCIGNFRVEKNFTEAVHAFARVAADFPDWTLRIVGDGAQKGQIEAAVEDHGLAGRVVLPGASREVAKEYASADIVVIPSLYEAFGLVAAEAMAAGRPVIAFKQCLGIADMVEHGQNGFLIEGGDDPTVRIDALADAMTRLMSDDTLRAALGAAAPSAADRYSLDAILDQWEGLLQQVALPDRG